MAESKPVVEFKFDAKKCAEHLNEVEKQLLKSAGKRGHNPYSVISERIAPLRERLTVKGETSKELSDTILALDASKLDTVVLPENVVSTTPTKTETLALQSGGPAPQVASTS